MEILAGAAGVLGSSSAGTSSKAFCSVIAVFLLLTLHSRICHNYLSALNLILHNSNSTCSCSINAVNTIQATA